MQTKRLLQREGVDAPGFASAVATRGAADSDTDGNSDAEPTAPDNIAVAMQIRSPSDAECRPAPQFELASFDTESGTLNAGELRSLMRELKSVRVRGCRKHGLTCRWGTPSLHTACSSNHCLFRRLTAAPYPLHVTCHVAGATA